MRHLVFPGTGVVAPRVVHGEKRAVGSGRDAFVSVRRAVVGGGELATVQGVDGVGASCRVVGMRGVVRIVLTGPKGTTAWRSDGLAIAVNMRALVVGRHVFSMSVLFWGWWSGVV